MLSADALYCQYAHNTLIFKVDMSDPLIFSRITSSTSSTLLVSQNNGRDEVIITNNSTANMYITYGLAATATNYTLRLGPNETLIDDLCNDAMYGFWDAANGFAHVTEVQQG